jgi:hypothetical protein
MPNSVAFADNTHLARNKTPPLRITKRVRDAVDIIVETGAEYQQAAAQVGLSTYALRLALAKPHVLAYLRGQLQVLRGAREPRTFHRLCAIADAQDNMPAVQALRTLQQLGDEQTNKPNAPLPGVTIRIVNVAQPPPPMDIRSGARVIDAGEPD